MPRATFATARTAFVGLLLSIPVITSAATFTGEITISACVNQTNGQVRIVKPWGPDPECVPPTQFVGAGTQCTEGGQRDCKVNEFFIELNTQGPKGDTGPTGPQGPQGDQGPQGYSASVAPAAVSGCHQVIIVDSGGTPVPGAATATVCDGAPGKDGADGAPGAPGTPGLDGAPATVTIGTTNTVPAGTPAAVTNSGTPNAAVLNFSIPEGPKGDKGDPGVQGVKGDPGDPGPTGTEYVFCGASTPYPGTLGGYVGAKNICMDRCGSDVIIQGPYGPATKHLDNPKARMCRATDMIASEEAGLVPPGVYWISTGNYAQYTTFDGFVKTVNDCRGWLTVDWHTWSTVWDHLPSGEVFTELQECNLDAAVACCAPVSQ